MTNYKLILASASPRRKSLLKNLSVKFEVILPSGPEITQENTDPLTLCQKRAFDKAYQVASGSTAGIRVSNALIIGADTIVLKDQEIFGKPRDRKEAEKILKSLSGKKHRVITAIAVVESGTFINSKKDDAKEQKAEIYSEMSICKFHIEHAVTEVTFYNLSEAEIKQYLDTGEYVDKAGAYGIQGYGAILVASISGCYYNVVGLPLATLHQLLQKFVKDGLWHFLY